jgi:hypothetical protein
VPLAGAVVQDVDPSLTSHACQRPRR